jgi:hypothetical protein
MTTWTDIPGYGGAYQASFDGEIRRIYKNGKTRIMSQFVKKTSRAKIIVVKLSVDGFDEHVSVSKLVALTFLGECPKGCVVHHINGIASDNALGNIEYINRRALSRKFGGVGKRHPVAKLDMNGEEVSFYSSAREAARENNLCVSSVTNRCTGKIKSIAPDGFDYAWDDDKSLKRARQRIEKYRRKHEDHN